MLTTRTEQLSEKLNLIDVVERLGIGYHFEPEIEEQLQQIYNGGDVNIYNGGDVNETADLSTVALQFRLLRQHGYNATSDVDVFNNFKNEEGTFKKELGNDVRGMLSMYEAAYFLKHGETVLDEAIEFTTSHLANLVGNDCLGERVTRALKRPLRKGVEKHEQLFFISSYEREEGHNQMLLELAKLSWNVLQDLYQQELRDLTKWWIELDFAKKLSFARDRLVEVYFWAVATMWEPKFSLSRYLLMKTAVLISITDDMYDVHGTNDELEVFTDAVERWDTSMKDLPEYMTLFYKALIDLMDEIDSITSNQGRAFCAEYAKQEKNQMRAYLTEARWFAKGEVPTVQEYRRIGLSSCGYPLLACSTLCGLGDKAPKEAFDWLMTDPKILIASSDICRLTVDGWKQGIEALKEEARVMLTTRTEQLSEKLNLIDVVERLGIGYHFEPEIEEQLQQIYNGGNNEEGTFKKELGNDVRGMLSMYEAAYHRKHGEIVLDEAIEFTTAHLTNLIGTDCMGERVTRALKRPLWKGVEKHEQLFFISSYEREEGHNQMLLELAKLSWNVLQDLYQQELRDLTKWWIELDFANKLSFARDRLVEVYFWAVATMWEPKFSLSRYLLTKTTVLISITDDMYDAHGTNDELEVFTDAVERWDTSMKDLPEYMTLFYKALIDLMDEIDSITSNQGRAFCAEYAKQAEKNQMRAYLTEARWFAKGEVPTVQEYRRIGLYSCGYPLIACSTLCGLGDKAPKEAFDWLMTDPKILIAASDICRLQDDIVSHKFEQERGHVASSFECYMKQYNASRKQAVDALSQFIEHDWRDINEECLETPDFVSREVVSMFLGLARVIEVMYKEFDGYTVSNTVTRDMMTALLVTPIVV
ncbi:(-)-germacrene D synthase [Linum perenne]